MGQVSRVWDTDFHGIDCLDDGEEYGFEGYYNENLNHPDQRPGHAIWIKKMDAEKLMIIFYNKFAETARKKGYDFAYTFDEFISSTKDELNPEDKKKADSYVKQTVHDTIKDILMKDYAKDKQKGTDGGSND